MTTKKLAAFLVTLGILVLGTACLILFDAEYEPYFGNVAFTVKLTICGGGIVLLLGWMCVVGVAAAWWWKHPLRVRYLPIVVMAGLSIYYVGVILHGYWSNRMDPDPAHVAVIKIQRGEGPDRPAVKHRQIVGHIATLEIS